MRCARYDTARAVFMVVAVSWAVAAGAVPSVEAQGVQLASRSPRFMMAPTATAKPVEVDAQSIAALRRRITVNANGVTLEEALRRISRAADLRLMYSKAVVPLDRQVVFQARNITVAAALTEVLFDADVDVLITSGDQAVLTRRDGAAVERSRSAAGAVAGKVTDAKTGQAITGAEVFLDGTRWRAMTDTAGRYRLTDVTTGDYTLTARRVGFAKHAQKVTVRDGQEDTVDVALTPVATRLNELVTTATGQRRRLDVANDVTTINADSVMQAAPVRSLTDLLENRVPGLLVQHTSGAPGDPSRLRLRGASSLFRSNDPIVVVDGIRVYAEQSAARSGNLADLRDSTSRSRFAAPSPLDYIDPNTIEKIEVLKGPSAATLYGQDAANGVIVITTKKGHAGPTRWTASFEQGRTGIEGAYPELLFRVGQSIYGQFPGLDAVNCLANGTAVVNNQTVACRGDSVVAFQVLNDPALTVLDRGHRTALALTASGGSQALTYSLTGSYGNELGIIKLPSYELDRYQTVHGAAAPDWMQRPQHLTQWGVKSAVQAHLGAKAEVSLTAELSRTEQQRSSLEQQLGDLMGTYFDRTTGTYNRQSGASYGPVDALFADYYQRVTARATQFTNGAQLAWHPRSWLQFNADAGVNVVQRADQLFHPRGTGTLQDTTGWVSDAQGNSVVSTLNARADALRALGRGFQFRFAVGVNYTGTATNDITGRSANLPPGSSLQGDSVTNLLRAETSDATFGWYAEPSIGNSTLNFTTGLRLDGGSAYGRGVSGLKLPKFPKLGFSYLLSDEPWFPLKDLVQSFRLRVAYGQASRQPGPKDRLRLYSVPGQTFADAGVLTSTELATLGNTKLLPERSTEMEGGVDTDLLDNRLSVNLTWSRKTTDDALMLVPVAPSVYTSASGQGVSVMKNIGRTRNTSLELAASAQLLRSGTLTWTTQLALTQIREVVVSLGKNVTPFYTDPNFGNDGLPGGTRIAPGYPIDGRWSRPILGYADANGDGVLQNYELQLGDTAVYVGSTRPNYNATMATTVGLWRTLTLNALFSYQNGLTQRNEVAQRLSVFSAGAQVPGTSVAEQAATGYWAGTDYNWIQTVNTLRFASLSIAYRMPATIARRLGAQNLSVALQGDNLGLWSNYRGLDPNVNAFGTGNNVTDTGVLPQSRTWQLRVSATY